MICKKSCALISNQYYNLSNSLFAITITESRWRISGVYLRGNGVFDAPFIMVETRMGHSLCNGWLKRVTVSLHTSKYLYTHRANSKNVYLYISPISTIPLSSLHIQI